MPLLAYCRYTSAVLVLQEDVPVGNHLLQPRCLHKSHHRLFLPLRLWTRYQMAHSSFTQRLKAHQFLYLIVNDFINYSNNDSNIQMTDI